MKGVFAVYYKSFGLPDEYRVVFYQSEFEMALMQFLYSVYTKDVIGSGELVCERELSDLRDDYLGGIEPPTLLGAAIFFKKHVTDSILAGFRKAAGKHIASTIDLNKAQYGYLAATHAQCIKRVIVNAEEGRENASYCTVGEPLSYLFRTELDRQGNFKQWLLDKVIFSVIKLLADNMYGTMSDFKLAVAGLAGTIDIDSAQLFMMVQSLMVTELVNDTDLDVHQPFNTVLAELLEKVLGKEAQIK